MKQFSAKELQERIQKYIDGLDFSQGPQGLYDPIDYVLGLGGKRLRPVLMMMAYNLYCEDVEKIYSQAAGMETYHNFTLLHDDLMDKADMRRGKSTVHKKWNENTAILSGDAMLILAYRLMAQDCIADKLPQVLAAFGKAALEVCDGQQWDMEFEDRKEVLVDEYMNMIRLKTSVLLAASLQIGAVLAGASERDASLLYEFGVRIGLAFQLQDDFLDVYGDPAVFGKNIGGDILCNKKTYMLISALEKADDGLREELLRWIDATDYVPVEKIAAVTHIYNVLGIDSLCRNAINQLYEEGIALLDKVEVEEARKDILTAYVRGMMNRNL